MVELVYKFDEKSTASVRKGKSTAKVPFKPFCGSHTVYVYKHNNNHINGHQPRSHNPLLTHAG